MAAAMEVLRKAAHSLVLFLFLFVLSAQASIPRKCKLGKGANTYMITNWTWKVVNGTSAYYINICDKQQKVSSPGSTCHESSVCSTNVYNIDNNVRSLGLASTRRFNVTRDGTGFTVEYDGGSCWKGSEVKWSTKILVLCGKLLGAPKYIEESVSSKGCKILFEFVTNEACKKQPKEVEIPCSLYSKPHELIDLSPLIKLQGGYEVSTADSQFGFHINVCRGITAGKDGHTHGCPKNSSMCRINKSLQNKEDVGSITLASNLIFNSTHRNEVILHYNTSKKADGCPGNPVTTITFVCPQHFYQSGDRGPKLTAARQCHYEVLWETEFACPQSNLMATSGCVLSNEFVNFDLSKLTVEHGNYMVNNTVSEKNDKTRYVYYINVCKSTGLSCAGINSTVCQEEQDGNVKRSLGDISTQKLRYADGELILTYQGGTTCSSGIKRSTVITFKCDYHTDKGEPVFSYEDYCLYFFDWKTKYACPPSRRTGTRCRVESESGIRYDLSELVRLKAPNWIALDGESSRSDREIYVNVCGQLHLNAATEKCDRAAAVCMVTKSTGKVTSLGRYTDPPSLNPDHSIKLVYTNGGECRKDADGKSVFITSDITFVCHPGDLESPPVLVSNSQDSCHYQFMWKSAAACSLGVNIGQNCKVQDKDAGYVFDLGPLAKKISTKGLDFYSIKDQEYTFQLKICGGSNKTGCNGSSNIGACQVDSATQRSWKLGEPNSLLYYYDGMINLTYPNGDQCNNKVNRTTHITFLCDLNATKGGLGDPQYEKENHCVYNFIWFTKYACPAKVSECVATSNADQYDLTSLVRTQDNWEDSSSDLGTFYINVCRSLNLSPAVFGCSGTAAVCLKIKGSSPVNLGEVTDGPVVQEKESILISYVNGDKCGEKQHYKTNITFHCDPGETSSGPIFDGKENDGCTYKFRWKTAAACVIKNVEGFNCAVKDPKSDTLFNLLPLMRKQNEKPYNVSDGKGGMFLLNICGNVADCDEENAGACQVESGDKKIVLGEKSTKLRYEGEILTLSYENGYNYVAPGSGSGRNREVHINFYCNPKVPIGEPAFTEQVDQKFFFDFQTSLACASSAVQCLLTVNRETYDLSPLGLTVGNWEAVDSRSQNKHLHYYINVCRAVNPTSDAIRCPGGPIGACQIDHKSGKGFNMGYIQSNPTVSSRGELTLQYLGGSGCHGQFNRSTRIIFSCSKYMGSPISVGETPECEYIFTWETPSACVLTKEYGTHCKVEDKQYFYMFDMSKLYNETHDYNISVSGSPGEWIVLNICNNLKASNLCPGNNAGAYIHKEKKVCVDVNSNLSYYNGQINMTYRSVGEGQSTVLNIVFECLNTNKDAPRCQKVDNTHYLCHWPTSYACRPLNHMQCSIRNEDGSVDEQYDFSALSQSATNWQAKTTQPHFKAASYFINVCRSVILTGFAASCPPTAGVCMVTKDKRYVNLGTLRNGPVKNGSSIFLEYKDGDNCKNGTKYSTRIQMECGSTEGEPVYVTMSEQTCVYDFLWITSTACPLNTKNETVFDNCTAINPQTGVVFDLTPLKKSTGNYVVLDQERRKYSLNVCGPVNNVSQGCSTSSGVCQVGSNTYNAGNANSRLHFDNGILYLNYTGGDYCHHAKKTRETIISFVCNSSHVNTEYGEPVFIAETADCTYHIMWHTQLVCERQFECAAFKKDDNGYTVKYSLGQLVKTDVNWVVTSLTGDTYYINLCRPLLPIPNVLCPAGSWACRVRSSGAPQGLGQANGPAIVDNNGVLHLVYISDISCTVRSSVELHFTFTCAHGSLGTPVLESTTPDVCIVRISWATSAACPDIQKPDPEHCRVFDNATAKYYDLSPLKKTSQGSSFFTVEADSGNPEFYVSVCGGMELAHSNPCNEAGVCMISKDKKYTPLGVFSNWHMTFYRDERMMTIKYCNDRCDKANISSQIIFICDEKSGLGNPKLETYGIYGADFVWRTSLVCPPLEEECVFKEGSNSYDLQLLSSRTSSWHYVTEQGKSRYWINLCRGIRDGPKGCPPTASVCLKTEGSNTVSVLGFTSTQRITKTSDKFLLVRYSGKAPVETCLKDTKPTVTFHLECGSHVGQPTLDDSSSSWSACSFIFKWKTKVACNIKKEPLREIKHCVVKNPTTEEIVDFNRLNGTYSITGKDESNKQVKYNMNVCGFLGQDELPAICRRQTVRGICFNGKFLPIKKMIFNYEGFMFSLWLTTNETCPGKKSNTVVVINFLCSVNELGSPKFEYESSNCHHVFSWPTSVVCTGDLSHLVTDPPVLHKAVKSSSKKSVGIAFGVVAFVVLIVLLGFVLYKPSRRHSLVSCVRWNFKKHILRKEIKYPVYRYEKLIAGDEDEADALLEEAEGNDDENEDDDDLLAF